MPTFSLQAECGLVMQNGQLAQEKKAFADRVGASGVKSIFNSLLTLPKLSLTFPHTFFSLSSLFSLKSHIAEKVVLSLNNDYL